MDPHIDDPEKCFEAAVAAFDGLAPSAARPDMPTELRKIVMIALHSSGADTLISSEGLEVRWPHIRRTFSYQPGLGPGLVAILRSGTPADCFGSVHTLSTEFVRATTFERAGPERWIWPSRTSTEIRFACRAATPGATPPLDPVKLPRWERARPRFLVFPQARACATCSEASRRFRLLTDGLVCLSCGCSEALAGEHPAGAHVEEAG